HWAPGGGTGRGMGIDGRAAILLVQASFDALEDVRQIIQLAAQVITGDGLTDRGAHAGDLPGQELRVRLGFRRAPTVLVDARAVAVLLPVLRQQNQRRGVRGLRGERQVQQDERVRVPVPPHAADVQRNPDDDDDRLVRQVLAGAEEAGDALRHLTDAVAVEVDVLLPPRDDRSVDFQPVRMLAPIDVLATILRHGLRGPFRAVAVADGAGGAAADGASAGGAAAGGAAAGGVRLAGTDAVLAPVV